MFAVGPAVRTTFGRTVTAEERLNTCGEVDSSE